jgi:Domain of unknown function (DUF4260)
MSNNASEALPAVPGNATGNVLWLLRVEGLAVVLLSAVLYWRSGAHWWLFAALWLVPDLSMLGYLAGPRWGARCYDSAHTYIGPLMLAAALLLHRPVALSAALSATLPVALIWCNHIGVDRLCGYGIKYPEGFGFTHLKKLGKKPD